MKKHYVVKANEIKKADPSSANFILFEQASSIERDQLIEEYSLPTDVFDFFDLPAIAPRIEYIKNTQLGHTMIFVLANISEHPTELSVEERLESHTFILGENEQQLEYLNEIFKLSIADSSLYWAHCRIVGHEYRRFAW